LPWNYAELTEVRISEAEDETLVRLVLGKDGTSLSARCSRVPVDRLA
jgi:hypothetical protein